ncbi:xanthine dehydrogenase, molybdenum binding subunit apoprotein [Acidothermus cellulolyticus 11B]|uniref:Xanthine dehydrogenase, molybdenum binding subunit apoprotein n=1 Tax=Acidothermus cellulolyticus (strain ATCC 43068 / DSM 8971 / 11B) TaxID=351607 RepID=A0LVF4_ACIC1|nr:xanthine dehydrogenase family protein molybdopterin-binding subunit [Acidothermus cellulolyticus]ABK53414.1 xanthine dehydrogenase, molybdenum binding subunit apoprotein [Acidothermus cellulolyticus 11B]MCL6549425.1 xanthine dehydrogenase family protein molybdopterin-binding subunit [Acidothermus cellulolyticus]
MSDTSVDSVGGIATDSSVVATDRRVVGKSIMSHDFIEKVKGSLLYAEDWSLPGMLLGKVVRSPMASARIRAIDVSKALEVPGVAAVLTARDVPVNRIATHASGGLGELDVAMPVLAADRVRYAGEPVALVAAETRAALDQAAELVDIDLEPLPGVYDPLSALLPDAPLVHEEGNVLITWNISCGDVEAGFREADVVVEEEYRTQFVEHAYLEPEAAVAWMDQGILTIRAATQVVEHAAEIAEILNLPQNRVRVISTYMGGGFGGKEDMTVEPYVALLAWYTRRPVRMIFERQESILATTKRAPFVMKYKTGARRDGVITAQEVDIVGDAGAYPYLSARVMFAAAVTACGPYRIPHARVRSRAVFTNQVPTSAFRGFGAMEVVFGYEGQMDRLARVLNLPPDEIRKRNFLRKGDLRPTGERVDTTVAIEETLDQAMYALGAPSAPSSPRKRIGRGLACNMQPYGRTAWFHDQASVWLSLSADGSLTIRSGITDLGGGQAASLCQIASEVLGVSLDEISVHIGDTALNPPAGGTFATRQLYMSGNAVLHGALELRRVLADVAAGILNTTPEQLEFRDGAVFVARGETAGQGINLATLARECESRGVSPAVLYTWRAPVGSFDPTTGKGATFPDYTYGAHAAEVEVDLETGCVTVLKYVASHDVGRSINPLRVEGQIQGGVAQGLGYALMEEVELDEGIPKSTLFADYLVPTALEVPDITVRIVESGEGKGPMQARGIGEPPIGPVAAAIASAIADAIGIEPRRLPMTPERLLDLLRDNPIRGAA